MFRALARLNVRFRWIIVAFWLIAVIAGTRVLPTLSSVVNSNNAHFLSSSSPSVQAGTLVAPFGAKNPSGTGIIVASRSNGPLSAQDLAAVGRMEQAASQVPGVSLVKAAGPSRDGKAAQVVVEAAPNVAANNQAAKNVVDKVRSAFSRVGAPPGLQFNFTGPLAVGVDASNTNSSNIQKFTLLFVIVLLFVVYRAALAPIATLIPAVFSLILAQGLVAQAAKAGLSVAGIDQQLMIVLLLGAGTDYGLFLAFRVREELARRRSPHDAVVEAMSRVGEAITYSGLTVAAALLTLLLASFGIYQTLGPVLAIGIGVLLIAFLTLAPALLAIFGRAAFWPSLGRYSDQRPRLWGKVAERVVQRPMRTLVIGVVLLGVLAAGLLGYRTGGLTSTAPAGSDSAAGAAVLTAHFPTANVGADQLAFRYPFSVWSDPTVLQDAQRQLAGDPAFRSITGPLGPGAGTVTPSELASLHAQLGPASSLPALQSPSLGVPPAQYHVYQSASQYISPDGKTIQFYAVLRAGPVGSTAAAGAIPQARESVASVARSTGAIEHGIAGQDASAYDISSASNKSLLEVIPVVLALIIVLLALLLRSLVAPWYLALSVGLSYLASLGFAMTVFVHIGGSSGLIFALPLLMFVFSMALGEDYNILLMSRIREEAVRQSTFRHAVVHAIGITGGTITSAGMILAGTFAVLGLAGGSSQAQQLGFSIAFGVLLDTFFVRTLLVPSTAILLGRWNWWPSALSRAAHPR